MPLGSSDKAWAAIILFSSNATSLDVTVKHEDLESSAITPLGYECEDGVVGEVAVIESSPIALHRPLFIADCDEHFSESTPIDFTRHAYGVVLRVAQEASDRCAKVTMPLLIEGIDGAPDAFALKACSKVLLLEDLWGNLRFLGFRKKCCCLESPLTFFRLSSVCLYA